MPNIEFVCPNCSTENNIAVMGETKNRRTFEKKCKECKAVVEFEVEGNDLINTNTKEQTKENTKNKVPTDYNLYNFQEKNEINSSNHFWVKAISFLILTASIMGLMTGVSLYYAPDEFSDSDEIKIYIIVENKTNHIDSAELLVDNENINQTYSGNGTYIINLKPGKYNIRVSAEEHKTSVMDLYIPPQDPDLSLIDYSSGLEGINSFTFTLEKGEGTKSQDENTYLKMLNWCPTLILLFSLIGIWGSWVTYTLQSYKNAQIGAFFSIIAMGFLVIGPLLGIIALILLPKIKKNFTGHFKK